MTTFGAVERYGVVNLSELREDRKNCVSEGNTDRMRENIRFSVHAY